MRNLENITRAAEILYRMFDKEENPEDALKHARNFLSMSQIRSHYASNGWIMNSRVRRVSEFVEKIEAVKKDKRLLAQRIARDARKLALYAKANDTESIRKMGNPYEGVNDPYFSEAMKQYEEAYAQAKKLVLEENARVNSDMNIAEKKILEKQVAESEITVKNLEHQVNMARNAVPVFDFYKTYIAPNPNAVTFGNIDGTHRFMGLTDLFIRIPHPTNGTCLELERIAQPDSYTEKVFDNFNSFLKHLCTSSRFLDDPKDIGYFRTVYGGVKSSLVSGELARFRTKNNEPKIKQMMEMFERYIAQCDSMQAA